MIPVSVTIQDFYHYTVLNVSLILIFLMIFCTFSKYDYPYGVSFYSSWSDSTVCVTDGGHQTSGNARKRIFEAREQRLRSAAGETQPWTAVKGEAVTSRGDFAQGLEAASRAPVQVP